MSVIDRSHAQRTALIALGVSLLLTCLLGCAYVFRHWSLQDQPIDGLLRCITLVCAMVALHAWAYRAYASQFETGRAGPHSVPSAGPTGDAVNGGGRTASTHWAVLALAQQLGTSFLAFLLLDGGTILKLCLAATGTYWASVGMIALMRRSPTTAIDQALLRVGFFLLLALLVIAAQAVWIWKGVL